MYYSLNPVPPGVDRPIGKWNFPGGLLYQWGPIRLKNSSFQVQYKNLFLHQRLSY